MGLFSIASQPAPTWLPLFNSGLIGLSGIFLLIGFYWIKRREIALHRFCMLTATVFAAAFLVVYVARALLFETKVFAGEGIVRAVYLAVLGSHTILAMLVGPLVLITLYRGLRGKFRQHRAIARYTFPVWLYVVVTGWVIYLMLHSF